MGAKQWTIFAAIVIAVVGGLIFISMQGRLDISDIGAAGSGKIVEAEERNGSIGDHVFGNRESKVLLVEYGDFQCNPGCRLFHENFKPIMQDESYKSKIAFVYRNFPIVSSHPNAMAAAASAEAAGKQGKYWEMWDTLFANQAEWSAASSSERGSFFKGYAEGLALDINKFNEDVQSDAVSKKIKFDRALGAAANVTGTPTMFLNGEKVDNEKISSTDAIKQLIDEALKKQ